MLEDIKSITMKDIVGELLDPSVCSKDTILADAIKIMNDYDFGSVIIVDKDNKVEGIFTERDILKKIVLDTSVDLKIATIGNFMTKSPRTMKIDDSMAKGMLLMRVGKFRHLIVVDDANKLLKVCSLKDFLDFMCDKMETTI